MNKKQLVKTVTTYLNQLNKNNPLGGSEGITIIITGSTDVKDKIEYGLNVSIQNHTTADTAIRSRIVEPSNRKFKE